MSQEEILRLVQLGLSGSLAAAGLFTKALEAINSGDQQAAEAYLAEAQTNFDRAVEDWRNAG